MTLCIYAFGNMYAEKLSGSKSDSKVEDGKEIKTNKKRSASSDSSTPKCKKQKSEKHKRKKKELSSDSSSSDSSQTCSSSSSSDERRKKLKKTKHKKEKKRKSKKEKKKKKRKSKKHKKELKEEELIGPVLPGNSSVHSSNDTVSQQPSKVMAPMTKEEWEKRQGVVRRVFDEETGRYRLIKGDGEVLEEIVSRERHREINKQATLGDGAFFQAKLSCIHHK